MRLQITIPVPSFGTWPGACDRVEFSEALLSSMFVGRGGGEEESSVRLKFAISVQRVRAAIAAI
jgi:hypothetical protein